MNFYIEPQYALAFVHVLLFGYWLGADLGVYFCDSQLIREDLTLEERLRVRQIRYKLDIVPRTCLIMIMSVGFTLALQYQSPVRGPWLVLLWVVSLAWLWVVWQIFLKHGTPFAEKLARWDINWRYLVAFCLMAFGVYCWINNGPIVDHWLDAKLFIFGCIILNGVWIRIVAARWEPIFNLVRAGGESRVKGEAMMKINRSSAGHANMTIWSLVLIIAFLGMTKPF